MFIPDVRVQYTVEKVAEHLLFQMIHSLKAKNGEPERFKSGGEARALLSDLNRRLGLPADNQLSYGQFDVADVT